MLKTFPVDIVQTDVSDGMAIDLDLGRAGDSPRECRAEFIRCWT